MRITADLGDLIRKLRDARGYTRKDLAEQAGVSISHLEKIESGLRNPGINTFINILVILDVNVNLHNAEKTVQEKALLSVQDIFLGCTEGEVRYLTQMVKCMADKFPLIT